MFLHVSNENADILYQSYDNECMDCAFRGCRNGIFSSRCLRISTCSITLSIYFEEVERRHNGFLQRFYVDDSQERIGILKVHEAIQCMNYLWL